MDILIVTCTVISTGAGLRWFEYQCMRYVYNTEKACFEPYEFDLGSTNKKLQAWATGITTEEASERLTLLGPNIIKVEVPSIPLALVQE